MLLALVAFQEFVPVSAAEVQGDSTEPSKIPLAADLGDVDPSTLQEIDFDDGKSFDR